MDTNWITRRPRWTNKIAPSTRTSSRFSANNSPIEGGPNCSLYIYRGTHILQHKAISTVNFIVIYSTKSNAVLTHSSNRTTTLVNIYNLLDIIGNRVITLTTSTSQSYNKINVNWQVTTGVIAAVFCVGGRRPHACHLEGHTHIESRISPTTPQSKDLITTQRQRPTQY